MRNRSIAFIKSNLRQVLQLIALIMAFSLPWLIDFNKLFESWLNSTDTSPENVLWHLALSWGRPALACLLLGLLLLSFRNWNSEYEMNQNSVYHDYSYLWYWFCSKILGIKKCNLILVPIYMQFKLVIRGTFADYPLESDDFPPVSDEKDCEITIENNGSNDGEINIILEDTYVIESNQIPKEKRHIKTVKISRYDGTNNRHFSSKLVESTNTVIRRRKGKFRVNIFATTNPMNSKQIAKSAFVQGGRGNITHLYVYQQKGNGRRAFDKQGKKIY